MSFFVHEYDYNAAATFRAIPDDGHPEDIKQNFFFAGLIDNSGLFASIDRTGNPVWQKQYTINKTRIFFSSAVRCDNGDYLLHGSYEENKGSRYHTLVIRTNAKGDVQWGRTYFRDRTRFNTRLIKSVKDTYYFISWYNQQGTVDDIELVKIDGKGNVIAAVNVGSASDDQENGLIPYRDGCIIFGGTSQGQGWDNFVAAFDANLNLIWGKLVGDSNFQEIRAMAQLNENTWIITGETGTNLNSYLATFSPSASTSIGNIYNFKQGQESGTKRLLLTSKSVYLAASATTSPQLSFVVRFDHQLAFQWQKNFILSDNYYYADIQNAGGLSGAPDELLLCGYQNDKGKNLLPLASLSDADLTTCITQTFTPPRPQAITFNIKDWKPPVKAASITVKEWKIAVADLRPLLIKKCPSGECADIGSNPMFQSPYIYLQAAGSDFSDQTVKGFHLRWDFLRSLGESHLPKGNLSTASGAYPTTIGFNKPDDYVRICKARFKNNFEVTVNFNNSPTQSTESGPARFWVYENLNSAPGHTSDVSIHFMDKMQYDAIRAGIDPMSNSIAFITAYTGIIEARMVGKLIFSAAFNLGTGGGSLTPRLRAETISLPDQLDVTTRQISSRSTLTVPSNHILTCENIEYIRFDYQKIFPTHLRLSSYEDCIRSITESNNWTSVGSFSLDDGNADANAQVFRRLEDTSKFTIHKTWPKFNEYNNSNGEFLVNVQNYRNRWTLPSDGLKEAVITYLDKSKTDVKANVTLANTDPQVNFSNMEVSYLDMLDFVSLDFHVARMLGMGTIDADNKAKAKEEFVYLMQYVTTAALENETPATVTHLYMSLPVTIMDFRLPPKPELLPLVFGLPGDNCGSGTSSITDINGYAPFADVRYINLHRNTFRYELPFEPFFVSASDFDLCDESIPVFFGAEYGSGAVYSGNFVRPEISSDSAYSDTGGLKEVAPIPNQGENPVYTHSETHNGLHHYGLYSINWFSRISPVSNEEETDTQFPKRNTLLPPSNFAVQLIQPETPRIFTTLAEQNRLGAITSGDKTLVRVTFDWNHIHNQAYQFGNKAELFFRIDPPLIVRGAISSASGSITIDTVAHTVTVKTASYLISSTNPPQTVQPFINAANVNRFANSRFIVNGDTYIIDSILTTGNNPEIKLRQIRVTASQDTNNDNVFCTVESWLSPASGDWFLLVENLDQPLSWDTELNKQVDLIQFSPTYTETVTYPDGQTKIFSMGGLTDTGTITNIYDTDPTIGAFIPPGGPPASQVPTGVYKIHFNTKQLSAHPDSDVEFYQGTIRVHDVTGEIKELRVWKIDNTTFPTLELTVFDSTFGLQRDPLTGMFLLDSGFQFIPEIGYVPIATGAVSLLNFHPSYRAYFYAEIVVPDNFGETAILPAFAEGMKQTYMAVRSIDTTVSPNCFSFMATPAILLAQEIREPVPPGQPIGGLFATRPNFYGKASYTFDAQVDQPFSLVFYRANDRKILDQLYKPDTVKDIYTQLDRIGNYDIRFTANRWFDLVHVNTDSDDLFIEHVLNGFRFPIPDNDAYIIPDPDPSVIVKPFLAGNIPPGSSSLVGSTGKTMREVVMEAIEGAFLPLTELPLMYGQLASSTIQTSGRKPKLRNSNGDRLIYGIDADYDPWPMSVKFEKNSSGTILLNSDSGYGSPSNTRFVRFSDYTLDGAAKNIYFYFGVELSNTLKVSGRSPITGPVQLTNAAPPEAPAIRQVAASLKDPFAETVFGVNLIVSGYLPSEGVTHFKLYRAMNPDDALNVRTMTEIKEVKAGDPFFDDFSDLGFVPFTDPLFYRVVAFRQILNEHSEFELIPSQPSKLALTNVVDNTNPQQPSLSWDSDALTPTHPLQYNNVQIKWNTNVYKGTYHLYKMNETGTWVKIFTTQNSTSDIQISLAATSLANSTLLKEDDDGDTVYHLFRIQVENSSGLVNKEQNVLRI